MDDDIAARGWPQGYRIWRYQGPLSRLLRERDGVRVLATQAITPLAPTLTLPLFRPAGEGTLRVSFAGGGEMLDQGLDRLRAGLLRLADQVP